MAERKYRQGTLGFITDIVILILIAVNLSMILFEWIYVSSPFDAFLETHWPAFHAFYDANIHEHFFLIDLGFIAIYLLEITIQWIYAAWKGIYRKWWYYPFIHWYDVLGCIPISTFRFFRVLRVFSLIVKMQRLEIIDLTNTFPYQSFVKYRDLLTEEITDRVVLRVLSGMQAEVKQGSPVSEEIGRRVIEPRREKLVAALSRRIQYATQEAYAVYRPDVRDYVDRLIKEAVDQNRELGTLKKIPIFGKQAGGLIEHAITDIVFRVVNDLIEDVAAAENNQVVNHVAEITVETLFKQHGEVSFDESARDAVVESLEVIKEHVRDKQREDEKALEIETREFLGSVIREVERPDKQEKELEERVLRDARASQ